MTEELEKKIKKLYDDFLKSKLDLVFDFTPDEKEESFSLGPKRYKKVEPDGELFISEYEPYWGPHGDFDRMFLKTPSGSIIEDNSPRVPLYGIGNNCYVHDKQIIKVEKGKDGYHSKKVVLSNIALIDPLHKNLIIKEPYQEGLAVIEAETKNGKLYNFIDYNFKKLSLTGYTYAENFSYGCAIVGIGKKFTVINNKGKSLLKRSVSRKEDIIKTPCFIETPYELIPLMANHNDYSVKKKPFQSKYICQSSIDKFETQIIPLRIYDPRYTLGILNKTVFLYDRFADAYQELGKGSEIEYSDKDNFIINKSTETVYLVYEGKLLDVSKYYKEELKTGKKFSIKKGVTGLLSYDDFCSLNMNTIDELIKKERKANKEIEERIKSDKEIEKAKVAKQKHELKEKEKKQKRKEHITQLQELIAVLQEEYDGQEIIERAEIKNIFIEVEDHLEFHPALIGILKFVDLSKTFFINVKMSNIDFRGTNLVFDPQTVYKKDLSNSNFEGLHIMPFLDFTGVNIKGCRFSKDNDPRTIDYLNSTFEYAIYDDSTTYDGIPLKIILNKKDDKDKKVPKV